MDIVAAAGVNETGKFPREGVALDSWANVWLRHQRSMPESYYTDVLNLAFGSCLCHRETGMEGVPTVHVPYDPKGENIDLFPEGFLWERGCDIQRGTELLVISPKGRRIAVQMCGSMPYNTKNELNLLLSDLPEHHVMGRSGRPASPPKAARAAICTDKVDLNHLKMS